MLTPVRLERARQFLRFGVVGAAGFVVDASVLYALPLAILLREASAGRHWRDVARMACVAGAIALVCYLPGYLRYGVFAPVTLEDVAAFFPHNPF